MPKKTFVAVTLIGAVLLAQHGVYAQECFNCDLLAGRYNVQLSGQAVLSSPTSGNCVVSGTVPASLGDCVFDFNGHGSLIGTGGRYGVSIGATTCTSANYVISGAYTVVDKGDGTFESVGTFTTLFGGRLAGCAGTRLTNQPFSLIGKTSDHSFTITTAGAGDGSAYAEGSDGSTTCTAAIINFITSGSGRKF